MSPQSPSPWKARLYKWVLNLWPCIRGTGARVEILTPDFSRIQIKLPLNWRTRNRVGTIFGGSLYAAIDPFYMLQLMELLGRDYVVWDKAASIRFRRPGTGTLRAELLVGPERLAEVRRTVEERNEADFVWPVVFKNEAGQTVAEIEKTIYVAKKEYYRAKRAAKAAASADGLARG